MYDIFILFLISYCWPDDSLLRPKHVAVLKYKTFNCVGLNIKIFVTESARNTKGWS
jgi:hypothetical protein